MISICSNVSRGDNVNTNIQEFGLVLALLLVTLTTSACTSASPAPPPLTLDALKNTEYQSAFPKSTKAKLTGGVYQEEILPDAASKLTIQLADQYAIGDLTGDGVADAAVILSAEMGGGGKFYSLAAVLNEGGKPVHIASASLGAHVEIKAVSIQGGEIEVDMLELGPTDPMCCPTIQLTQRFKLQDGKLVSFQQPAP
jgi:hypothetical protein